MIKFINAKINVGLHIIKKRPDGYHDLETVFYPVGLFAGTPVDPSPFCDILELIPAPQASLLRTGRAIACETEDDLVWKAWTLFETEYRIEKGKSPRAFELRLEKHLPDGAGMGGGSADAVFTLKALNEAHHFPFSQERLRIMAARLGADCPFFLENIPSYAVETGRCIETIPEVLKGKYAAIVKPDLSISTKEAFAGVASKDGREDLRKLIRLPIQEWKGMIVNDFESSLFPRYPELADIKKQLYDCGALYASLTGSGAALYGIFLSREEAADALRSISTPYSALVLL